MAMDFLIGVAIADGILLAAALAKFILFNR